MTTNKTKILVIEDVHYLRNDVMEMLRFEGFDVRGAENGVVGVEVAREYLPDLIVCDIMMPEMDGFDVLETLRNERMTRNIPFIFLTAKTDRLDMRKGMGKGADDYVTKPFLSHELMETIRARLSKLEELRKEGEERMKRLRDAITMALPHELRTPLNTIIGFSDIMMLEANEIQPPQILEWSQHINSAALRLYRLVENYLTYVRIETLAADDARSAGLMDKVTANPAAVIEFQAILSAQQTVPAREPDLELKVKQSAPVVITEADLTKVIDELLSNAFKFSEIETQVTVAAEVVGSEYQIQVSDQGRGMTQEQIDSIGAYIQFERYVHEQQGTGLGLVIAQRLVELHGGKLDVTSALNEGTTVTVTLRLAPQDAKTTLG
jgi:signal transduction histidine kinase